MKRALGLVAYALAAVPLALCVFLISYGAMWGSGFLTALPSFFVLIGFSVWFVAVGRKLRS